MKLSFLAILITLTAGLALISAANAGDSGSMPATINDYKILAPISHGDLTIFPVVSARVHDTSEFITLDEGIRSGEVVVTEVGNLHSTMRRRPYVQQYGGGAEVNRLVLVNNSRHPLILLAGEVVTGGKQDRVVGKDRIVPAESDPVDLSVFCVEHGRWTETSANFGTKGSVMLQPSVRMKAMADQTSRKCGMRSARAVRRWSSWFRHSRRLSTPEPEVLLAEVRGRAVQAALRIRQPKWRLTLIQCASSTAPHRTPRPAITQSSNSRWTPLSSRCRNLTRA